MFNQKNIHLKLFLATIFVVIGIHSLDLSTGSHNLIPGINVSHKAIARQVENYPNYTLQEGELIAKKSGGRSGGGSFKSRSSGSKSRSRSSSSTKRKSSSSRSNRRSSSSSYDSSPTYRTSPKYKTSPTYRHSPTHTNTPSHSSHSQKLSWLEKLIIMIFVFLIIGVFIFLPVYLIFKAIFMLFNRNNSSNGDRLERKISRERDNNKVTVSQLQVALSPQAEGLQQELSTLSLNVNTNTDEGLVELMRESVLILLRHDRAWTHVLANSNSLHISHAEEAFDKISLAERSKFSSESLSNVDGKIKTTETVYYDGEDFSAYVVVTLILGTADDNPLLDKIHTEKQLKEVLLKLASMREDYLMKFELLWTPQKENEYLTDDELLMEYTNMIKLV